MRGIVMQPELFTCCLLIGFLSLHAIADDARKPKPNVQPGRWVKRSIPSLAPADWPICVATFLTISMRWIKTERENLANLTAMV